MEIENLSSAEGTSLATPVCESSSVLKCAIVPQISFPFLSVLLCSLWWIIKLGYRHLKRTRAFRAVFGNKKKDLKVATCPAHVRAAACGLCGGQAMAFIAWFIRAFRTPTILRGRS